MNYRIISQDSKNNKNTKVTHKKNNSSEFNNSNSNNENIRDNSLIRNLKTNKHNANAFIHSKNSFYSKHTNLNQTKSIYLFIDSQRDSSSRDNRKYNENKFHKMNSNISPDTKKFNNSFNRIISTAREKNVNKINKSLSPIIKQSFDKIVNSDKTKDSNISKFISKERDITPKPFNYSLKNSNRRKTPDDNLIGNKIKPLKNTKNLKVIRNSSLEDITNRSSDLFRGTLKGINMLNSLKLKNKKNIIRKIHGMSQPGINNKNMIKTNQDSHIIKNNILNLYNFSLFGVYDGHGVNGHHVSDSVKNMLLNQLSNKENYNYTSLSEKDIYKKLTENKYSLIKKSFINTDYDLAYEKYDYSLSGTTAIIVIIIDNKLICANTGDSRAILVVNDGDYDVIPLSRDHKPDLDDEKQRIICQGGIVEKYILDGVKIGPYRVWLRNQNYPGLAMSRSLGDFLASSIGVICEPEVSECEINEICKYVVIASDGLWEFLTNEEVMDIVNPFYYDNNIKGAVDKLINEASIRWVKYEKIRDDITVIIIFF